ncbi:hypothetical protein [Saccharibacillus sp. JS10]|uniref:hypothetical protein n=1 Tax=Saccharibacillus sp. JS10 TaxID=2950552 RepID=UPI00210AC359|nr:hypothetical protein [Saccharibacillus sp. JS10]MCQ4088405.1 hypothetical protein [Saccharibacillus sp. JS10]
MLVEKFEFIPREQGTFLLKLNGHVVAENFYNLEAEFEPFIQIDVCSHCHHPGCSDDGFIEVLNFDHYVVWKKSLDAKSASIHRDFQSPSTFDQGTLFWAKEMYIELINVVHQMNRSTIGCWGTVATLMDLQDMWRLEGAQICSPETDHNLSIEQIYEKRIGLYHVDLSEKECEHIFEEATQHIESGTRYEIFEINSTMKPIVMMFDTSMYIEWQTVYLTDNGVLYPLGNDLAVKIS